MNDVIARENEKIENLIYEIRGLQVMLDSELAPTKWHGIKYKIYYTFKTLIYPFQIRVN